MGSLNSSLIGNESSDWDKESYSFSRAETASNASFSRDSRRSRKMAFYSSSPSSDSLIRFMSLSISRCIISDYRVLISSSTSSRCFFIFFILSHKMKCYWAAVDRSVCSSLLWSLLNLTSSVNTNFSGLGKVSQWSSSSINSLFSFSSIAIIVALSHFISRRVGRNEGSGFA